MTQPPSGIQSLPSLGSSHRSLGEQVATVLRERIVTGDLAPGTHLVERALAETLGVSRVPVRDALNILKGEGFVKTEPRRGVVVTRLTRDDLEDLFDVRSALEAMAARLAAQRATPGEIRDLEDLLDRAARALAADDQDTLRESNEAFHDAITRLAHHDLLTSILEPLSGRLHWILRQNVEPQTMHREHENLFRAIAAHDAEKAAAAALSHVATSREQALRVLYP